MASEQQLLIIGGNAHPELTKSICRQLKLEPMRAEVDQFSEGETKVVIGENVRGSDVFIIQPTGPPVNQNYMELLIIIDALKRASAGRITVVMPYYGYARQDRKDQPRVPISAKLMANLITAAGADRIVTLDLHAHQIQGFFDIPLDHLYAAPVMVNYIREKFDGNLVIVSPDAGGVKMAYGYARRLGSEIAIIDKRRIDDKNTTAMNIIGDVKGRHAVIVDDIVATGGSLVEGTRALLEQGATKVSAVITHGILSGPAIERISKSKLDKLVITDSIVLDKEKQHEKIEIVSVSSLLAQAIERIHGEGSVSSLFQIPPQR